eukprot:6214166-Pleurochrysis_carterae.AAC.4
MSRLSGREKDRGAESQMKGARGVMDLAHKWWCVAQYHILRTHVDLCVLACLSFDLNADIAAPRLPSQDRAAEIFSSHFGQLLFTPADDEASELGYLPVGRLRRRIILKGKSAEGRKLAKALAGDPHHPMELFRKDAADKKELTKELSSIKRKGIAPHM